MKLISLNTWSVSELKAFEKVLDKAKIKHSGINNERHSKRPQIWFDDPNGLRLEFYLRN